MHRFFSSTEYFLNIKSSRASLVAQGRIHLQWRRPRLDSWVGNIYWRRHRLPTPVFLGFPVSSAGIASACSVEDLGLIPGLGRPPGEGNSYPLQNSDLENSMAVLSMGSQRVRHDWVTLTLTFTLHINLKYSW